LCPVAARLRRCRWKARRIVRRPGDDDVKFVAAKFACAEDGKIFWLHAHAVERCRIIVRRELLRSTMAELTERDIGLLQGVAETLAPCLKRIEVLEQRVIELEARPALKYLGTWKESKTYSAGTFITDAGAVWYCNASTTSRPGENADWSLAVKSGAASTAHPRPDATATSSPRENGHYAKPRRMRKLSSWQSNFAMLRWSGARDQ
jgi:hypothetical protein